MRSFIFYQRLSILKFFSSSWAINKTSLRLLFTDLNTQVTIAFWIFGTIPSAKNYSIYPNLTSGLINNVSYVIILSAALDLVGPSIPKGIVLVVDVFPSFVIKLTAPYFIHKVLYSTRILLMCFLSAVGMYIIALAPPEQVTIKLCGVVLASLSSGLGEMSLLGLTHFYGSSSLAAWGSGTGGAGIIGAGLYVFLTSIIDLSIRTSLLVSATLPIVMPLAFFFILPQGALVQANLNDYTAVPQVPIDESDAGSLCSENDPRSNVTKYNNINSSSPYSPTSDHKPALSDIKVNIRRARSLIIPYMLPLLLVYSAEYTINQGVSPILLFPLNSSPFSNYRSFYPTYAFLYQFGVFISRSSLPFYTLNNLFLPSLLQVFNLLFLICQTLFFFIPSVYIVFVVIFWEGLLGGAVYVNTFAAIMRSKHGEEREWSLGATTASDSAGILIAGLIGILIEPRLCQWNVRSGRTWCQDVGGAG